MGSFFYGLSLIFPRLLDHTVEISVLICLIFLVKVLAPRKLPPWWHYSLWLLLLVRMLVPLEFENRLNVFNFVPTVSTPQVSELIVKTPIENEAAAQPVVPKAQDVEADIRFAVKRLPPILWLTGAMVLGICIVFESLSFWRSVRRRPRVTDEAILALLAECKSRMKIRRKIDIVVTENVRCPALFGYLKPRLLLPEGIFEKLSDRELAYAFMHELGHLKRHDIGVSWLIAVLQVIHWFNPLVWLAFYQIRIDQESACDAAVLSGMKHKQSAEYAKAIVGFLEKFCQNCQLPALAGVLENRSQMKKRIAKIVQHRKTSQKLSFAAVILLVSTGFLLFTLTGVEAEKRGAASLEPALVASYDASGIVMDSRPGDDEKRSEGVRGDSPAMTYPLLTERDFLPALEAEASSVYVPQGPVPSPQYETADAPRAVPNERMETGVKSESSYAAPADTPEIRPSDMFGSEPMATSSPVSVETHAAAPAVSNVPASVDGPPAVASETRQAAAERLPVQTAAEQEQAAAVVKPVQFSMTTTGGSAEQPPRAGNHADLREGAAPVQPVSEIQTSVRNDTAQGLVNEKDRLNSAVLVAVNEMMEKPAEERYRESAAPVTAKQGAGRNAGAFQAAEVDTPPRVIKGYPPRYPYLAKRDDISGSITLQFVVTKDGNAVDTTVVESDPKGVFDEAAMQAVERYRFKPGIKDGEAVDVKVNLPIKFNLT